MLKKLLVVPGNLPFLAHILGSVDSRRMTKHLLNYDTGFLVASGGSMFKNERGQKPILEKILFTPPPLPKEIYYFGTYSSNRWVLKDDKILLKLRHYSWFS